MRSYGEPWNTANIGRDDFRRLFAFEDKGFVYFLLVRHVTPWSTETRLARVCIHDQGLKSYMEMQLICKEKAGVKADFQVARAATVALLGEDIARKFGLENAEDEANRRALYVVMERASDDQSLFGGFSGNSPIVKSGVCIYRLAALRKAFTEAQQECYGVSGGRLVEWLWRPKIQHICNKVRELRLAVCFS
jgi:hypothetical protein